MCCRIDPELCATWMELQSASIDAADHDAHAARLGPRNVCVPYCKVVAEFAYGALKD